MDIRDKYLRSANDAFQKRFKEVVVGDFMKEYGLTKKEAEEVFDERIKGIGFKCI